jgi:hypothetical protein
MEVLSLLNLIGNLPFECISTCDIANISRFLTKASMEKQILVFNGSEVVGVCILLLLFLKAQQEVPPANSDRLKGTTNNAIILHEVLRGVAQIVLLSADKIQPLRAVTLRILLHFSKVLHDSIECRFTAIDAIGNLLLSSFGCSRGVVSDGAWLRDHVVFSDVQRSNLCLLLQESDGCMTIEVLHDRCIWTLIDNLKVTVSKFTRPVEGFIFVVL